MKAMAITKQLLIENGRCELSGAINLKTVPALYAESLSLFKEKKEIVLGFSQVSSFDSAIVALLLAWVRMNKQEGNQKIIFKDLPEKLCFLVEEYKLNEIIKS